MAIDPDRIRKPIRKIRKFLKKSPKTPTPDQVHDLRTSARRLETVVNAVGAAAQRNGRQLLRDVSKIRKRAGKVRDMDVLTGHVLTATVDGEQDCLVQLVEVLGANRSKYVKKLRTVVTHFGAGLRGRLKRADSKLQKILKQSANGSQSSAAAEVMAKALELAGELRHPPRLNKTNLHPYRLKVKELGYVLQLAQPADQQEFVDALGEVKDAIGEWHDWGELIAIASEVLDHGAECKLVPKLRAVSEEKYQHALSLANQMRHEFLAPGAHNQARRGRGKPAQIKPPVLAATSAISE